MTLLSAGNLRLRRSGVVHPRPCMPDRRQWVIERKKARRGFGHLAAAAETFERA